MIRDKLLERNVFASSRDINRLIDWFGRPVTRDSMVDKLGLNN